MLALVVRAIIRDDLKSPMQVNCSSALRDAGFPRLCLFFGDGSPCRPVRLMK